MSERLDRVPSDGVVVPAEEFERRRGIAEKYHKLTDDQKFSTLATLLPLPRSMWDPELALMWGLMETESRAFEAFRKTPEERIDPKRKLSVWERLENLYPPVPGE